MECGADHEILALGDENVKRYPHAQLQKTHIDMPKKTAHSETIAILT